MHVHFQYPNRGAADERWMYLRRLVIDTAPKMAIQLCTGFRKKLKSLALYMELLECLLRCDLSLSQCFGLHLVALEVSPEWQQNRSDLTD
jgi:hypothetical protein